ncbi:Erp5 protein [Saccharomycopsis crataegensis]|uniref:Erp5 protein n=1 Tax=Saccharomycopsis crataegensis TaxID=43959 RepID=A0AAV5QM96_9ASCO|nr:Erp5 protein [Saccharomycopsis crataegensis]
MKLPLLFYLSLLVSRCIAIHFYMKPGEQRCFYEELPSDTLVVVKFESEIAEDSTQPPELKMELSVDETFDNDHRVVSQKSSAKGEFTFTSLDSGEHKFCLGAEYKPQKSAKIRIFLDVVIGNGAIVDTKKMDEVGYLIWKINDLNTKTEEIKREHSNIREREAVFRDQSENVNSRIVKWTLFQCAVLLAIGLWQLKHLKTFFIKEKVV